MYRLRLKLAKRGPLRFISHLETMHTIARAARRANLPLTLTQGFSPRAKISWGPPLPVGLTSESEYLDLFLKQFLPPKEVLKSLNQVLPPDLPLLEAKYVPPKSSSLTEVMDVAIYEGEVVIDSAFDSAEMSRLINLLLTQKTLEVERKGREKRVDLTKALINLNTQPDGHKLLLTIALSLKEESLRPEEIIRALFSLSSKPLSFEIRKMHRAGLFVKRGSNLIDPLSLG